MFRKMILVAFMCMTLLGAATTTTPFPVLVGMGCLILLALSVAMRSEEQG
jgi:hypothetical protein